MAVAELVGLTDDLPLPELLPRLAAALRSLRFMVQHPDPGYFNYHSDDLKQTENRQVAEKSLA